jgi:hypothetical protein
MKVRARKLTKKSLFKLLFIGFAIPLFPFVLLCGIASIFGAGTVTVNNQPVTGIMGLVAALIMYPIFCIIFPAIMWVGCAIGLWVYSKFRNIEVEFIEGKVIPDESLTDTGQA